MYYKGTEIEVRAYNDLVTEGEDYRGGTQRWAKALNIESAWYIAKHPNYVADMEEVNKLPIVNDLEEN